MEKRVVLVKYHDNFADNFTSIAYGKILENNTNTKYYFENITQKREDFEQKMSCFDMDYHYISSNHANALTQKAYSTNSIILDRKQITRKKIKKSGIINIQKFIPSDLDYLDKNITNSFRFKSLNFIKSYDILEEIKQNNSIGLYISNINEIKSDENLIFIQKATKRLNKYLKHPKLYIFLREKNDIKNNLDLDVDYEFLSLKDWKEEFHFLTSCKHKIILNTKESYSEGFWACILNAHELNYVVYDKKLSPKSFKKNWIGI